MSTTSINESILNELHQQAAVAIAKPVTRFIEVNPHTLLDLIDLAYSGLIADVVSQATIPVADQIPSNSRVVWCRRKSDGETMAAEKGCSLWRVTCGGIVGEETQFLDEYEILFDLNPEYASIPPRSLQVVDDEGTPPDCQ